MRPQRLLAFIVSVISLIFCKCNGGQSPQKEKINNQVSWQKNSYATFFRIGTTPTDTLLEIYFDSTRILQKFHSGKNPQNYPEYKTLLLNRHQASIAILTSAFSEFINQLHSLNQTVGVDNLSFWTNSTVNEMPKRYKIPEIQKGGNLDLEKLLQLKPNTTFTYTLEPKTDLRLSQFTNLVYIQNHFEVHPLAKAEWIKVFGYFLNKYSLSVSLFNKEKTAYESLKSLFNTDSTQKKPKIMINLPYMGVWWVPQKNNYLTQLIYDAGGQPLWITPSLSGSNSTQISTEQAHSYLQECNILLHPGSIKKANEISDSRIYKTIYNSTIKLWQNDLKMEANGANPFWDLGSAQPHLLLRDLQNIFYPNNENPYFYRQIKTNP